MERLEIPEFNEKKELFKFLIENKSKLTAQKKAIFKKADGFAFVPMPTLKGYGSNKVQKGLVVGDESTTELLVKAIINTTNLLDSHGDVHLPSLWDKSLEENKLVMHVQEHKSWEFKSIISDGADLTAFTKTYTWAQLGFPEYEGITQALQFDSLVKQSRNAYMFGQYQNGHVKNHSVGMRYVKIVLCVDSEDFGDGAEKEAFDKYIAEIANKQAALDRGWFWAVKEAKVIEGSAVPLGSNAATPTYEIEAVKHTSIEAAKALQKMKSKFYY